MTHAHGDRRASDEPLLDPGNRLTIPWWPPTRRASSPGVSRMTTPVALDDDCLARQDGSYCGRG